MSNKQYKITLKKGDACKIEGLTGEQYHQVAKRFIESGAGKGYYSPNIHRGVNKDDRFLEWFGIESHLVHSACTERSATIYTYEQIMEEESQMLERDKQYDIKLTGEQLAFMLMLTGSTAGLKGKTELYMSLEEMFKPHMNAGGYSTTWIRNVSSNSIAIECWLDSLFTKPETEQEKKIREMEEQYAALGKARGVKRGFI